MWASNVLVRLLGRWRLVVRDEVYLIGERLHNFGDRKAGVGGGGAPGKPLVEEEGSGAVVVPESQPQPQEAGGLEGVAAPA